MRFLALITLVAIVGCEPPASAPPGATQIGVPIAWKLADGRVVRFFCLPSSPPSRDTNKYLEIVEGVGRSQIFVFDVTHAGYNRVELRASPDQRQVWLLDVSRSPPSIGCSYDYDTGQFAEGGRMASTAQMTVVAPMR